MSKEPKITEEPIRTVLLELNRTGTESGTGTGTRTTLIQTKVVSDSQLIRTEPIPNLGARNRISRTWGIGLVEFLHETFQMNQI